MTDDRLAELIAAYDNDFARLEADLAERKRQFSRASARPVIEGDQVLEAASLFKTYKSGKNTVQAVRGVSFSVNAGEMVALTGPSGSGKSTVLNLLSGLDRPDSGSVTISGSDITKMGKNRLAKFRCRHVGFVFQFFYLQPFLNVARNVTVPAMFLAEGQPTMAERDTHANELVESVGLADRAKHLPNELSGGQMQRAAIARSLINRPKLLLADEPTGNLDSQNAQSIMDLFDEIRRVHSTAIIIVTHDPQIAAAADRTIRLVDGEIA